MQRSPRVRSSLLALSAVLAVAWAPAVRQEPAPRTVAIGDIHGAHQELVGVLRAAGLVDELGTWTGGSATLVQTGDMLDRGADVRRVMDLLIRLQGEAANAGGRVVVLLGNHEIMNLVGARQDVTPEILASFVDRESETRQRAAYRDYEREVLRRRSDWIRANSRARRQIQADWMERHPPGLLEMVRALGPAGSYGRWLRSLPVALRHDDMLFMHAGLSEQWATVPAERIERRVHAEIEAIDRYRAHLIGAGGLLESDDLSMLVAVARERYGADGADAVPVAELFGAPALPSVDDDLDEASSWAALERLDDWLLFASEGPLWFRGYARWGFEEVRRRMPSLLQALGVSTLVVGHTPQPEGIRVRGEGSIYLIDTGMLTEVYRGRGEALILEAGTATAVRGDGGARLLPAPATAGTASPGPRH